MFNNTENKLIENYNLIQYIDRQNFKRTRNTVKTVNELIKKSLSLVK